MDLARAAGEDSTLSPVSAWAISRDSNTTPCVLHVTNTWHFLGSWHSISFSVNAHSAWLVASALPVRSRFRGFAVFGRCVPRQDRGLVWDHGRGTRPGLLADPGLPSHPPVLRALVPLSVRTSCLSVHDPQSRAGVPAPAWSKQIRGRLSGVAPYRYPPATSSKVSWACSLMKREPIHPTCIGRRRGGLVCCLACRWELPEPKTDFFSAFFSAVLGLDGISCLDLSALCTKGEERES
jgi:hypothetical protein